MSNSQRIILDNSSEASSSQNPHLEHKSLWSKWIKPKKQESNIVLTETFDINEDYENFRQAKLKHFKPEILYSKGRWSTKSRFLTKCSEEAISLGDEDARSLEIISKAECLKLSRKENHNYSHIGMIVVGIKGLTRAGLGVKAFITIYDDSIPQPAKKLIVNMEVDMNQNRSISS